MGELKIDELARVLVGTSGFKYSDWKGDFYPPDLADKDMLTYYSKRFQVVELDFTYYVMPALKSIAGLEKKTPSQFEFCVKAHRSMTHEIPDMKETKSVFEAFLGAMRPLLDSNKLGCLLFQFPWKFRPSKESFSYLSLARGLLGDIPTAVEFRNRAWVFEEAFSFLRENRYAYCCVDEPRLRGLMPPIAKYTACLAYIRFHGRNAVKWWNHVHPSERYDYRYSTEELSEWTADISLLAREAPKVYVLFNNCHAANAARNALDMKGLLSQLGGQDLGRTVCASDE